MRKHINLSRQETGPVLEEASALIAQRQEAETKKKLLDAFSKHFIMSEDQVNVLTSSAEPVDDRFFTALTHMKQIHKDCEVLLGGENQRLGLELMEQSSKNLNAAFQKLYKWIQKEFRSLNLEDPQMSSSIRRALRVLAERPSLFHNCLDFFAEAREYILSDSFHDALTDALSGGNSHGATKPIEFSAHDPLRYVGDMLAWVHSTTVSEREALESLFVSDGGELAKGLQVGINTEPWSRIDGEEIEFDGRKALSELVSRDLNGVARSLRQRIELVIQSHEEPVTIYKIISLLAFYESTFSKLVGTDSSLIDTIFRLERYAFNHFETLVQDQVAAIAADPAGLKPPSDLGVPEYLVNALGNLTALMKAYDTSFGHEQTPDTLQTENRFTPVIRLALDPFLDLAKNSSGFASEETAQVIFQTNCFLAVRTTITPYPFACVTHLQPLSTTLTTLRTNLLDIQHDFLLNASGLAGLLNALEPFASNSVSTTSPSGAPQHHHKDLAGIASLPEFQAENLSLASQQLDDFLPSALVDATEHLKRIHNPSLVKSVTEEAIETFCSDFEFVESMIIGADEARDKVVGGGSGGSVEGDGDEKEGDGVESEIKDEKREESDRWSLRALFPRTTGEIRVLLS